MQSFNSDKLPKNPRESANPFSAATFSFTLPLFFKGYKKVLEESDIYQALNEHKSDYVGEKLYRSWEQEIFRCQSKGKEPSLLKASMKVFGPYYMFYGVLLFFYEICLRCYQPLLLGALVASFSKTEDGINDDQTPAYLYALGLLIVATISVCFVHPNGLALTHCGLKMRAAICNLIYRKALRLSHTALGDTTTGQVVNLISNDVGRITLCAWNAHYLWIAPLQLCMITYLMYRDIGNSAFVGVLVMLLFVPLQLFLGKKMSTLRLRTALCTDERIRIMNEILAGIQVIKMYAWEIPFGKVLANTRLKEMKVIRCVNYIRAITSSFLIYLSRISIFSSLVILVVTGGVLSADKAFMVTAFYNVLRGSMTVFFPVAVGYVAETIVSMQRIQRFLMLDETKLDHQKPSQSGKTFGTVIVKRNGKSIIMPPIFFESKPESSVVIRNLKAKWKVNSTEYTLDDVSLDFKPKQLVAIIGPVGSGKSSLIQAILGELPASSGSITVNGTLSYASQEPWLFTGTVRQNILFGQPMNRQRYNMTIMKCALKRDFELLPYGDKTIVGERGASLSGGQKARINLARAVYRQADIYLFDDPLSAVDPHVGSHLFEQCLHQYLREHTVILVTHQLQFLEQADLIVVLDNGQVRAVGPLETIRQSGIDYAKLLLREENAVDENTDDDYDDGKDNLDCRSISRQSCRSRQRRMTVLSLASTVKSMDDVPEQTQESRETGKIGFQVYKKYFASSGSCFEIVWLIIFYLAVQFLGSGGDYFLSYWTNKNQLPNRDVATDPVDIYIFSGLNVALVIASLVRSILFCNMAMNASTNLHNRMFMGVTRAAMYFFNTNPVGRVLNRFSKDMGQVDEVLVVAMLDVFQIFLNLLGMLVVICSVNPWYILPTVLLMVLYYLLRSFYLKTSRDIKRLEATTRSPIFIHLAASLNGLSTIRAFNAQDILIQEFDNYQDLHNSSCYMFLSTSRGFGFWLDCLCVIYIALITVSVFLLHFEKGGNVGLAITQAMGMTGMVQWGMRQSAELENIMTSVERVAEYENIEPEGAFESKPELKPPKTWPEEGNIKFENLSLRYSPVADSEYVLKSLNLEIKACEKVGIVGRTGAGKSSLINALFRLSYNDGTVLIDGRNISDMGLHDLRAKISIIPQDPVLFSGTMRYNLDPFDEYTDTKLWEALSEVQLREVVSDMPSGLLSKIAEGGANFSVGQRQLVCLARAILRENRILVMDEATANVDPQTDAFIQAAIRHKFQNCTVLTIAHRLHTVMDSDRVLVMDAGRAVEFGSPYELLTESQTKIFYGMVKQLGDVTFESLLKVAQKAYESNVVFKTEL